MNEAPERPAETPAERPPEATADDPQRLDPGIVASLYLKHADELRSFLSGVLRNADLAADALQATFTKAMEAGHTSRAETRKGWLFRVAFNEALQLKRRARIHDRSTRRATLDATHRAKQGASSTDSDLLPQENLIRFEVVSRVREALEQLPATQREVVRRRIYEEQTFATIAEELGLPLGTVLTRMRLALQKLAGRLKDED